MILLCFSLIDKDNLSNVTNKWNPELNHYLPNVVKILVGTKVDIRKESFPDDNSAQIEAAFMSTFISPKQVKLRNSLKKTNLKLCLFTGKRITEKSQSDRVF